MANKNEYGSKMIKVALRFRTNDVPNKKEKVAFESGTAYLYRNTSRGRKADDIGFITLEDILPKLKGLLKRNDIKLISNGKFVEL